MRAALAVLLVAACGAQEVVELTRANFDQALTEAPNAVTLVSFYAPWCGHCKELAPVLDKAATRMAGKVLVGKVDATAEGELATRHKIQGFPTVKLFKGAELLGVYQGNKNEIQLVDWVDTSTNMTLKLAGNLIQTVDHCQDLTARRPAEQVRYVGLLQSNQSAGWRALESAALELRKNRVAFNIFALFESTGAGCRGAAGCSQTGCWMEGSPRGLEGEQLLVSSSFLERVESLALGGQLDPAGLKSWMIAKSVPLVGDIDDDSSRKYFERNLPVLVSFLDPAADNSQLKQQLAELAAAYPEQFSVVVGDGHKYRQIVSAMGMSTSSFPQIAIDAINQKDRPTFAFSRGDRTDQPITAAGLKQFAQEFLDGKLQAQEQQQREQAAEPDQSEVTDLDDQAFGKLKADHQYVAVLFFAPWSSESLELLPAFRSMAVELRAAGHDIGFGKNDVTAPSEMNRDHSPTVPTVLLFEKGEPVSEPLVGEVTGPAVRLWLDKHLAKGASELISSKMCDQFLQKPGAKVLFVLSRTDGAEGRKMAAAVMKTERGFFSYGLTVLEAAPAGMAQLGVWVRLPDGHSELVAEGGQFTANKVRSELQRLRVPTVLDFGPEAGPVLSRFDQIPIVMLLLPGHDWEHNQALVKQAGAAARFQGRIVFLTINSPKMPQVAASLKISNDPNNLPAIRVDGRRNEQRPGMFKAPAQFELSVAGLQQLADDYLNGKQLERVRKSESEPAEPEVNGVGVLVGSSFDQKVVEHSGHAVVYFYAPWCNHCGRFSPIYDTFVNGEGAAYKANGVKFFKMDASENEPPDWLKVDLTLTLTLTDWLKVDGFPMVFLFKQQAKTKPVLYDGTPNVPGLRKFFNAQLGEQPVHKNRLDDEL